MQINQPLTKVFLDSIKQEFSNCIDLSCLENCRSKFSDLDSPLTLEVLSKCFKEDPGFWECKIKEIHSTLQPLNEQVNIFFGDLITERQRIKHLLLSRLDILERILAKKKVLNYPLSDREVNCFRRLSKLKNLEDPVTLKASENFNTLIESIENRDSNKFNSIEIFPEILQTGPSSSVLRLEQLLAEHKERLDLLGNSPRPYELSTRGIKLAHIVKAVELEIEDRNVKAGKKRKSASVKKLKSKNICVDKAEFPPILFQYVRGFFNVLRLLLLEMQNVDDRQGDGLTTDQLCELVRIWQSNPRAQRTNSPWINRCPDWSLLTEASLILLSPAGKVNISRLLTNNTEHIRLPKAFTAFDERSQSWYWLSGNCQGGNETETTLLARIFSLWAKAGKGLGGLWDDLNETGKDVNVSSKTQKQHRSCDYLDNNVQSDSNDGEEEDDDDDDEQDEEVNSSNVTTKRSDTQKPQRQTESVPEPYFPTEWKCQLSTHEQRRYFQTQEAERFSQPWSPFVYNQHGYASVVGPVRTACATSGSRGSGRAREHPLLLSGRPSWVSISEIVRDAVARLPNGEGTRPEIAMLVQDSAFLAPDFNHRQLSQCISSALDRLQGEGVQSPVMYDPARRLWIYRYRHLSPNEFYKLHEKEMVLREERFNEFYRPGLDRWKHTKKVENSRFRSNDSRKPVYNLDYIPDIDELTCHGRPYYRYSNEYMDDQLNDLLFDSDENSQDANRGRYLKKPATIVAQRNSNSLDHDPATSLPVLSGSSESPHPSSGAFSERRRLTLNYNPQ